MISWGRSFDLDFEIRAWPPLFRVAVTPFSIVVVYESVIDEIIAEVVQLATEEYLVLYKQALSCYLRKSNIPIGIGALVG
jgi:hypothetical protein